MFYSLTSTAILAMLVVCADAAVNFHIEADPQYSTAFAEPADVETSQPQNKVIIQERHKFAMEEFYESTKSGMVRLKPRPEIVVALRKLDLPKS